MALSCRPTMCIRDSDTTGDMVSPGGLSTFIAVGKNTKHPEEAFRFAQFVASEEAAVYLAAQGVLPAYSSDAVKESFAEACGVAGASTLLDTTIALESPNVAGYTEVAAVFQEEKEMYLSLIHIWFSFMAAAPSPSRRLISPMKLHPNSVLE